MGRYRAQQSNYDKYPFIPVNDSESTCWKGWEQIVGQLQEELEGLDSYTLVFDHYQGVSHREYLESVTQYVEFDRVVDVSKALKGAEAIQEMIHPDVTDDRVFGYLTRLHLEDFFDPDLFIALKENIHSSKGKMLIFGLGASLFCDNPSLLVYADMARWEIQKRQRKHLVNNLGIENKNEAASATYKHSYFVDWRVLDRHKKTVYDHWDYLIDANGDEPKMMAGATYNKVLEDIARRPFRVVPFFDPGPWGGQWMREVCDLDDGPPNYAWCFDCVPEENSLLLKIGDELFETPSINLVFQQAKLLLGQAVYSRFGDEFPIRFDFLDTMEGGNLSLQVHPLTEYIQEQFGMHYTQDESYYLLDADEKEASVYLGVKEGVDPEEVIRDLEKAQNEGLPFDAEKYVNKWPAKKHDHFSIPAGTIHCSGKGSMVLEISATPYIFTFKLWDWGRLGLDGKPRPINIQRGSRNIQWDRDTRWVKENLINRVELIGEGEGWKEERTGLHPTEFIETRRHWFTSRVTHHTHGSVNVLNLIEGQEAIVESPSDSFDPLVVHYAETFIIPEAVGTYTIRPYGNSMNQRCATIKAYVRHEG